MKDASVLIGFHTLPGRGRSVNARGVAIASLVLGMLGLGCRGATAIPPATGGVRSSTTESSMTDEAIFLNAPLFRCEPDILASGYEAAETIDDWLSVDELGLGNPAEDAFVASIEAFRVGTTEIEVQRTRSMRGTDATLAWNAGGTRRGPVPFHEASTTPDISSVGRLFDVLDVAPDRILATACRSEWGEPTRCVYAVTTSEGIRTIGTPSTAMVDPLPLRVSSNRVVVAGHAVDESRVVSSMVVDTIDLERSTVSRVELDLGSSTAYFGMEVVGDHVALHRFDGFAWKDASGTNAGALDPLGLGRRACVGTSTPTLRFRVPMRIVLAGTPFAYRGSPDFEVVVARDSDGACGFHVDLTRRWAGPGSLDGAVGAELDPDPEDRSGDTLLGRMTTPFGILETRCAREH